MTIGLMRAIDETWEITITDGNQQSSGQAHGLGITPDAERFSVKPKDGEDIQGDTITITVDATNVYVNAVSGPLGEDWTFEVQYLEGL